MRGADISRPEMNRRLWSWGLYVLLGVTVILVTSAVIFVGVYLFEGRAAATAVTVAMGLITAGVLVYGAWSIRREGTNSKT